MHALSTTPGLMSRLRDETQEQHQRAESRPFEQALFKGTLPKPRYVQMLAQRYLIHRVLEREARHLRGAYPFLGAVLHDTLFQEKNLAADLACFGVDVESIQPAVATRALCADIERLAAERPLALLGVYYVFEGSKNGARMIAKRVSQAYELQPGPGMLYLDPHGDQQRPLWMEFKQRMDACGFAAADQDAMVAAARLTFDRVGELDDELYGAPAAS